MAKDFLDELLEELHKLKDEELAAAKADMQAGLLPALPLAPTTVMKKVNEVARRHQMTPEELAYLINLQGPSTANNQLVQDYAESLKEEE